jgi:hypothetical protein
VGYAHGRKTNMAKINAKPTEILYVYSMGRKFRVLAIFTTDAEANAYMVKHEEAAVIACYGELVILASKYDLGEKA